ncbi:hypothetical protein Btru_058039 [Bulinus truncatus]|nr:hypothetical protein Btru_058039 [Bulinus truncatus]
MYGAAQQEKVNITMYGAAQQEKVNITMYGAAQQEKVNITMYGAAQQEKVNITMYGAAQQEKVKITMYGAAQQEKAFVSAEYLCTNDYTFLIIYCTIRPKIKMIYAILSITNFIFMVAQFVINGLSTSGPDGTVFINKTGVLSDYYYTAVTPAGWTFSIWGFIYAWQALWVLYSLINLCRKTQKGPVCDNPRFIPLSLLALCIIICCLNIIWLITFDRQHIEVSCAALIAYQLLMYAALFVSYRALDRASPQLVDQKQIKDIWLTRALVHNGLGIQATWVTIATLLNIAMVMSYSGDKLVSVDTAGTVVLSILSFELLSFAFADLFMLDRYSRYTITPYMVVIVALSGSVNKRYEDGERNSVFKAVLLAIAGALFVIKICVTLFKHFKKQRYVTNYSSTIGEKNPSGHLA